MKIYKVTAIILLMILSVTVFAGCTTFDNFKAAFIDKPEDNKATIQIGVYEPITGVDSQHGELEVKGIELARQESQESRGR